MKVKIDTTDSSVVKLEIDGKAYDSDSKNGNSQTLLPYLNSVLSDMGKSMSDITEVEVATGPGSFTGIRVGVSVAQTIGFVNGIKVNGKDVVAGEKIEIVYE